MYIPMYMCLYPPIDKRQHGIYIVLDQCGPTEPSKMTELNLYLILIHINFNSLMWLPHWSVPFQIPHIRASLHSFLELQDIPLQRQIGLFTMMNSPSTDEHLNFFLQFCYYNQCCNTWPIVYNYSYFCQCIQIHRSGSARSMGKYN